jgi:hypothetical protein
LNAQAQVTVFPAPGGGGAGGVVSISGEPTVHAKQDGVWNITSITNPVTVTQDGTVVITDGGGSITVDGFLSVGDIQITGDTTVVQGTSPWVVDASGSNVNASVSGTVGVSGPVDVSGSNVNASISGTVNSAQVGTWTVDASGSNVNASVSGTVGVSGPVDVSGSNVNASVSGTVDVTGSTVDANVSGTVGASQSGTWNVGVSGPVSVTGSSVSATVDGTVQAVQSGPWSVGVSGGNINATVDGTVMIGSQVDVSGSTVSLSGDSTF